MNKHYKIATISLGVYTLLYVLNDIMVEQGFYNFKLPHLMLAIFLYIIVSYEAKGIKEEKDELN